MFPALFAIPRTAGWLAQWLEGIVDPEQKIARPRQIFTGHDERDYLAIEGRRRPGRSSSSARCRRPRRRMAKARHQPPRASVISS
jgi:hypothetical protein